MSNDEKVLSDLSALQDRIDLCREMLQAGDKNSDILLDVVGFLEACCPRVVELIEAGAAGVLEESTLMKCLEVNDALLGTLGDEKSGVLKNMSPAVASAAPTPAPAPVPAPAPAPAPLAGKKQNHLPPHKQIQKQTIPSQPVVHDPFATDLLVPAASATATSTATASAAATSTATSTSTATTAATTSTTTTATTTPNTESIANQFDSLQLTAEEPAKLAQPSLLRAPSGSTNQPQLQPQTHTTISAAADDDPFATLPPAVPQTANTLKSDAAAAAAADVAIDIDPFASFLDDRKKD